MSSSKASPALAEPWDLGELRSGEIHTTTITATNASCKGKHDFEIAIVGAEWLKLSGPSVLRNIAQGESKAADVRVDLTSVPPGEYQARIVVTCTTCPPKCTQDVTEIEVHLVVTEPQGPDSAVTRGKKLAEAAISAIMAVEVARGSEGILIAEGDSWFDYPGSDVLKELRRNHGYDVVSVAKAGDTLENMVYSQDSLMELAALMDTIRRREPDRLPAGILLSGGGNDIAGPEFSIMLNHEQSGLGRLNSKISDEVIKQRLRVAMTSLVAAVAHMRQEFFETDDIPILIHGYSCPVPDGRGFLGGYGILPGPWLRPSFDRKGITDPDGPRRDEVAIDLMCKLIRDFNEVLAAIPSQAGAANVKYIDLMDVLSNQGDFEESWRDELHATKRGFRRAAAEFAQALRVE